GHREYLTSTSEKFAKAPSRVALLDPAALSSATSEAPVCARPANRPVLESRAEVEKELSSCKARTPRIPLVEEAKAREILRAAVPSGRLPEWTRLLARFPKSGTRWVSAVLAGRDKGVLDRTLRAKIAWVVARNDRAWYALGQARQRLLDAGLSDD